MKCIYRNYEIINSYLPLQLEITACLESTVLHPKWDHCIIPFPTKGILQRLKQKERKNLEIRRYSEKDTFSGFYIIMPFMTSVVLQLLYKTCKILGQSTFHHGRGKKKSNSLNFAWYFKIPQQYSFSVTEKWEPELPFI